MNEIEKAIKLLNAIKRHIQRNANKVGAYDMMAYGVISEDIDSIDLAIQALEKQNAKKPILKDYIRECSVCERQPEEIRNNYCEDCGNKFDWN